MRIYSPAHLHGPQHIGPPHTSRISRPAPAEQGGSIQDELDISDAGRLAEQARQAPPIRQGLVDGIRAKIAQGTYETGEKLEIAVERLLDEIG